VTNQDSIRPDLENVHTFIAARQRLFTDVADMDNTKATGYLEALLNKKLRIYTDDARMFLGDFKCTDNVGQERPKSYPYLVGLVF
jgi:hypothetical protein